MMCFDLESFDRDFIYIFEEQGFIRLVVSIACAPTSVGTTHYTLILVFVRLCPQGNTTARPEEFS